MPTTPNLLDPPIESIDQLFSEVIDPIRARNLEIDWKKAGLSKTKEVEQVYDVTYPMILKEAHRTVGVSIIFAESAEEAELLSEVPDSHKRDLGRGFWIALGQESIPPEKVTALRNWFWIQSLRGICHVLKLNGDRVLEQMRATHEELFETAWSYAGTISKRKN
jgi:hypothetical protein